ncbi:MAG: hypothetical protein JNK76_03845 [Planctomycetales bacterium]|jgi:hypothetical protein|nr:hypothetical protein [Planctomycetales bacterium]MBN8626259.1 hypothetical protein [Planctomycetota bacterium]
MWKQNFSFLAAGLIVGLVVGGFLPHAPIYAVATDRQDNFALATGEVDGDMEGVFVLDSTTGELTGALVNTSKLPPVLGVVYSANVMKDMALDGSKDVKFTMVTGLLPLRPGQGVAQWAASVIYIAEVNSGKLAVYGMPYNRGAFTAAAGIQAPFTLLYNGPFRAQGVVR